jgi:hypothetical protein
MMATTAPGKPEFTGLLISQLSPNAGAEITREHRERDVQIRRPQIMVHSAREFDEIKEAGSDLPDCARQAVEGLRPWHTTIIGPYNT